MESNSSPNALVKAAALAWYKHAGAGTPPPSPRPSGHLLASRASASPSSPAITLLDMYEIEWITTQLERLISSSSTSSFSASFSGEEPGNNRRVGRKKGFGFGFRFGHHATSLCGSFREPVMENSCKSRAKPRTAHTKAKVDWSQHFVMQYNWARHPEQHLWSPPDTTSLGAGPGDLRYAVWYQRWGMPSVYLTGHYGETLRRRLMDSSSNYMPWGPINARALLTAMRGVGHSLACMAKDAWRYIGCQMLEHTAPIVETGGFEGRLVGMLRDAGENINWREIQSAPRNPDYQRVPVYGDEMPQAPAADDSGWAFHDWVLNTQGWDAYKNKYGVAVELGTGVLTGSRNKESNFSSIYHSRIQRLLDWNTEEP
ncbi:uncharacterized protein LOC144555639 [Carex rostrata]